MTDKEETKAQLLKELEEARRRIAELETAVAERKRVEERLRESEERYRNTLDNMLEGCQIIGYDWHYLYVNDVVVRHGRQAKEPLLGHTIMEMYPGIENTEMFAALRHCMEKRIPHRMENEFTFPDGTKGWFDLSIEPIPDGIFILSLDITKRKRAEDELRESEGKYRTIFETTGTATVIIGEDTTISLANSGFEKLSGYSGEELEGKKSWAEFVAKDDLERMKEYHRLRRIDPDAVPKNYEFRFIDRQGNVKDIFSAVAMIPGTKKTVASLLDITERKRAEKKIQRINDHLQIAIDNMPNAYILWDPDLRIIEWNKSAERIFGYSKEEMLGKQAVDFIVPKDIRNLARDVLQKLKVGEVADYSEENNNIRKDGEVISCQWYNTPLADEDGKVFAILTLAQDITERKKMEEQLMVTDRLASIGELASGIAHELNNPLTGIIGLSELVLARDLPADVKEDLEVINREAQRTARIVKNLLTFARQHPQEKQSVNINSAIENVLELRAYQQRVNNNEVDTRFAPDLPEITADSFQLQQVFLNIVINAEHFMTEAHGRGTLTITTEQVGDIIRASFADDGPGIARENIGHLFDPFFTTKEVGKGTGLGLSISYGIITEHGGRIYAESEPGKGATFIVELPVSRK